MKKSFKITALITALIMACTASCGCVENTIGTGSPSTDANAAVETDAAGLRAEKDEDGYTYCEFKTSNPNWTLTWEDSTLKLSNGEKTFVYDDYRGADNPLMYTHSIMFYPARGTKSAEAIISADESEAVILHDYLQLSVGEPETTCATVVELDEGVIIHETAPVYSDILACHGMDDSAMEPYRGDNNLIAPTYKMSMTAEYKDGKMLFTKRLITDDGKIDLTVEEEYVTTISEDFEKLECDIITKEIISAFIGKNTAKLEELFGYESGMLDGYKALEFGNCKARVINGGKVLLTVDVTKSSLDTIPVGKHVYEIYSSIYNYVMHDLSRDLNAVPDGKAEKFVSCWLNSPWFGYMLKTAADVAPGDEMAEFSMNAFDFIFCYLDEDGVGTAASPTKDEYLAAAKQIFGLSDMSGFDKIFRIDDNGLPVYNTGHGGMVYYYDFIESDDTSVTVQFYADSNYTVKSHLVKYTFADGEYLRIVSSEIIEKAEYEPCGFGI